MSSRISHIAISSFLGAIMLAQPVLAATVIGVENQIIANNDTITAGWFQEANDRLVPFTVSSGNVGIGTIEPTDKLHVTGNIRSNNLLLQGDGTDGYIRPTNTNGKLYLGSNNTNQAVLDASGNVGIGIMSPIARLDVRGTNTANFGNAHQCCSLLGYTIGISENTGISGRLSTLQFHNEAYSEGFLRLTNDRVFEFGDNQTIGAELAIQNQANTERSILLSGKNHSYFNGVGNVGIGTTTPSAKLEVAGQVKITDGTQGAGKVLTSDANGLASWQSVSSGGGGSSSQWATNGSNIVYTGGNVGIGINNPLDNLSVLGNVAIGPRLFIGKNNTENGSAVLHFKNISDIAVVRSSIGDTDEGNAPLYFQGINYVFYGAGTAGSGDEEVRITNESDRNEIYFNEGGVGDFSIRNMGNIFSILDRPGTGPALFNITQGIGSNGGNVGIGTASPTYKLTVAGDIYADGGWLRTSGSNGWYSETYGGGWHMWDSYWIRAYGGKGIWTDAGIIGTNGSFSVGYSGAGGPTGGAIFAGNVGIGTSSPGQKLSVAGTIESTSGGFKFPDGTTQTTASVGGGVPAGAIMAFNLSSCPSGWIIADGANGTPDLRGEFIRGLDSGRGVDSGRVLGSSQADDLKTHSHQLRFSKQSDYTAMPGNLEPIVSIGMTTQPIDALSTRNIGGTETRPRNVALLYCQKQ